MSKEVKETKEVSPETNEVATHAMLPIRLFNEVFGYIMSRPMGEVEQLVNDVRNAVQTTSIKQDDWSKTETNKSKSNS